MISLQKVTDASGFANVQRGAANLSKNFRDAAMSTGQFEVQQMRLNSATDDYIKKLRQQKMGFREMAKQRKVAAAAYKQQLAMERMIVQKSVSTSQSAKGVYDVIIPDRVSADVDTARKRLAFMNHELRSGATQMVNWGKNTQWAGRQLMVGFTMPVAAFGAAVGVMAYNVDKELTRIAKVYDTVNTDGIAKEKELAAVRKDSLATAVAAAGAYGNAAKDTLQVQAELAATGKTGNDLQKSTMEVMRISRLGEVEHQTAIDATIALQSLWKLSNDELTESFDYMNSVENATSLATADFAAAIPIAGSTVREFGGDVKELGILLTAMKENGIGATEGANAIKASMQRLGRPSKQIRMEWQQLTGTDITKIVSDAGSLTEVFQGINAATKDLDDDSRRKAFAGLFGSYQVSRMMAMTRGMEDLENGVGQVSKAFSVSQESAESWAKTAEDEIERYRKSVSGQWDIALAKMKAELIEVGEPFVLIATKVLQVVGKIAEAFNNLPSIAKWFVAGGIAAGALAGGVLMLAGLTGNLIGSTLKGVAALGRFAGKLDLVDTETKASLLATEMATKAFLDEANAVGVLEQQMQLLTAAMKEANGMQMQSFAGAQAAADSRGRVGVRTAQQQKEDSIKSRYAVVDKKGTTRYRNPDPNLRDSAGRKKSFMNQEELHQRVILDLKEESVAMDLASNAAMAEGVGITVEEAKARDKRNQRIRAGTALVAIEGAAMTAMYVNSMTAQNEWVNKITQGVMVAGLLAPTISAVAPMIGASVTRVGELVKSVRAANSGVLGMGKGFKGAAASAKGMALALNAAMGPVGWTVAAITVLSGVALKIYNDQKKAREQAIKDQKTLQDSSKAYAENTGKAWQDYKNLDRLRFGTTMGTEKEQSTYRQSYDYFKADDAGKESIKAYDRADEATRAAQQVKMFEDAQVHMNMSAQEAAEHVKAFLIVSGESYASANMSAQDLVTTLGKLKTSSDWFNLLQSRTAAFGEQFRSEFNADKLFTFNDDDIKDYVKDNAMDVVNTYAQTLSMSKTPLEAERAFDEFAKVTTQGWNGIWDQYFKENDAAMEVLSKNGIKNVDDFKAKMANMSMTERRDFSQQFMESGAFAGGMDLDKIWNGVDAAASLEEQMVSAYAQAAKLTGEFKNIDDLKMDPLFLRELSKKDQKKAIGEITAEYIKMALAAKMTDTAIDKDAENMMRLQVNAILASQGLKEGATLAEALSNYTGQVADESHRAAKGVKQVAKEFSLAAFNAKGLRGQFKMAGMSNMDVANAAKGAMSGVQDQIADYERESLDARIEAERDKVDAYWDSQKKSLDRRQEREKDALDSVWDAKRDRLEAYWEARVEAIDKVIEREQKAEDNRKKMFEAEIARIERLADAANVNIDFNVALNEGNLDEAARISNNATATDAKFVFDREAERGSKKSEKRIENLELRKDAAEEAADRAMKAFDKREERAKKHFERMSQMEQDSLDRRAKADKAAKDAAWKRERTNLDNILKTFLAFTPRNEKQLREHMESLGISMKNFERGRLKPMGKRWGSFVRNELERGLHDAALASMSDKMWERLGTAGTNELLKSLGFPGRKAFNKFIKTGQLGPVAPVGTRAKGGAEGKGPQVSTYHSGGEIGSGAGSGRTGVARTYHGLHASEQMVRAQKGEFVVNRKDAKRNKGVLEAINSGGDVMGGAGTGSAAGFVKALVGKMAVGGFQMNMDKRVRKIHNRRERRQARMLNGGLFSGEAGSYGGRAFSAEQMKNAAIIASTGSGMGMSKRDVMIGIMTAIAESGLVNVNYGDRDSLGLFQQRPSMGWGTPEQVTNPKYASRKFFEALKGQSDRADMTPWQAAQAVQRSAFADGSNYRVWWDSAQQIFKNGLQSSGVGKGYVAGKGGAHHPTARVGSQGSRIHGNPPAIDIGLPVGNRVLAVRDGVVSSSYDIRGHEPRAPHGGLGYRSYGRVVTINHDGGGSSLYAHLSKRHVQAGQRVKGGSVIGLSGNTGYSTGPHLHFGGTPSPTAFLRKGAEYVKYDNTNATLHRGESVLTKNLTKKMHEGVDRFANGETAGYNGTVININGYNKDVNELAREVVRIQKREEGRQPQSRSVGGKP